MPASKDEVLSIMLGASEVNQWLTLSEVEKLTGCSTGAIRHQLRQLQKQPEYKVRKRMRQPIYQGIFEYLVRKPPRQTKFEW